MKSVTAVDEHRNHGFRGFVYIPCSPKLCYRSSQRLYKETFSNSRQGRPVNVKHDARCVMGKVGGKTKTQKGGGDFNLLL